MDWLANIQAVCFDMDGTLLDSEHLTDAAVASVLARYQVDIDVDSTRFHGVTWVQVEHTLQGLAPTLADLPLAAMLQAEFHAHLIATTPPVIAGSPQAVIAAAQRVGTAVVSSSNRASVEHVVARLNLAEALQYLVCAEDYQRSKPDPQSYQQAAESLGVECSQCLVFEDSVAGLAAARAAGMRVVAIRPPSSAPVSADLVVADFTQLPAGFFEHMGVQ